ncbi:MAG: FadR/GntR family transcriptional regulator [bacterium]
MFKKVKNQKLYLQIVDQIRNLMASGKLKAGDKLPPERMLAEKFGASRASIREAMSALEILGLIESKSSQGNFIKVDGTDASIDGELLKELLKNHSPLEVFEARHKIEPILAALAAERRTDEDIKKLNTCLVRLNTLGIQIECDLKNAESYIEEDRRYHLLIARSAHNSVLFTVYSGVNLMLKEKHWKVLKRKAMFKEGNLKKFEKEHTEIFNAIYNSNPELANLKMQEHMIGIQKDMFDN